VWRTLLSETCTLGLWVLLGGTGRRTELRNPPRLANEKGTECLYRIMDEFLDNANLAGKDTKDEAELIRLAVACALAAARRAFRF